LKRGEEGRAWQFFQVVVSVDILVLEVHDGIDETYNARVRKKFVEKNTQYIFGKIGRR
jgi:hypothetical protein